jgi:hypothetical protein
MSGGRSHLYIYWLEFSIKQCLIDWFQFMHATCDYEQRYQFLIIIKSLPCWYTIWIKLMIYACMQNPLRTQLLFFTKKPETCLHFRWSLTWSIIDCLSCLWCPEFWMKSPLSTFLIPNVLLTSIQGFCLKLIRGLIPLLKINLALINNSKRFHDSS